jgi:hypothetical protein
MVSEHPVDVVGGRVVVRHVEVQVVLAAAARTGADAHRPAATILSMLHEHPGMDRVLGRPVTDGAVMRDHLALLVIVGDGHQLPPDAVQRFSV